MLARGTGRTAGLHFWGGALVGVARIPCGCVPTPGLPHFGTVGEINGGRLHSGAGDFTSESAAGSGRQRSDMIM
jgi:hypothetical protein